jgi:hypothetical protein
MALDDLFLLLLYLAVTLGALAAGAWSAEIIQRRKRK